MFQQREINLASDLSGVVRNPIKGFNNMCRVLQNTPPWLLQTEHSRHSSRGIIFPANLAMYPQIWMYYFLFTGGGRGEIWMCL